MKTKSITTFSIDIIEDVLGNFHVCEFNQGVQSGGDWEIWEGIIADYRELFPKAFIDDSAKQHIQGFIPWQEKRLTSPEPLEKDETGLLIFRLWLDAHEEMMLRRRYRAHHPIIVDPLAVRAIYKNKAYAWALLKDFDIFPHTIVLTADEIQGGALLGHFAADQQLLIKCPTLEQAKGMRLVKPDTVEINLLNKDENSFFVVQPVIPTKGYVHKDERGEHHFNTSIRVYVTIGCDTDQYFTYLYRASATVADLDVASGRIESVVVNHPRIEDSAWKNPEAYAGAAATATEQINSEKLKDFVRQKIAPAIVDVMCRPFDANIRHKITAAQEQGDRRCVEVLKQLLKEECYFALTPQFIPIRETNIILKRFKNVAKQALFLGTLQKGAVLACKRASAWSTHLIGRFRQLKPEPEIIQSDPEQLYEVDSDEFIKKYLPKRRRPNLLKKQTTNSA